MCYAHKPKDKQPIKMSSTLLNFVGATATAAFSLLFGEEEEEQQAPVVVPPQPTSSASSAMATDDSTPVSRVFVFATICALNLLSCARTAQLLAPPPAVFAPTI